MMGLNVIPAEYIHFMDENIRSQTIEMTYPRIVKVNGGTAPELYLLSLFSFFSI